jgi:outer membrane lipoprotein SlyB
MHMNPLIAGAAVAVMILGAIGVAAITGVLPNQTSPKQNGIALADSATQARSVNCALCGTVEAIRTVEVRDEAGSAGALAGDAIGKDGSTTILRTDGGTASGTEIETSVKKRYAYRVTVHMDDGSYRTVSLSSPPALAAGDKVRVVEGKLVRA